MSAADFEGLIPKINSSSSIPELIEFIGYTFSRQDFDEVQSILINREDSFNLKIENLEKDYRELKKERDLLEKTQTILELEKLELKDKLKEKDKMIKQLNEDIDELKNQKLESENSAEISEEKVKSLEELRCKGNAAVEDYKKRFENFSARFGKVEQFLAKLFKVDESDLFNLANDIEHSSPVEKNAVNFLTSHCKKKSYRNDSQPRGISAKFGKCDLEHLRDPNERSPKIGESMSSKSPMVHPASESNGSGIDGIRETGQPDGTHIASDHEEPVTRNFRFTGTSSKMTPPRKSGEVIELGDSDDEATNEKFIQGPSFCLRNKKRRLDNKKVLLGLMPKRRSTYGNDDENLQIGAKQEKQTQEVKYDRSGSFMKDWANLKSVVENHAQTCFSSMHNPLPIIKCEERAEAKSAFQTPSKAFTGIKVEESTDAEDESFSRCCIDNNVASKKKVKLWMFGADMLKAFEEDQEVCLNAVCTLYRQQIAAEKSIFGLNLSHSGGLSQSDIVSVQAIGKYLIDEDPQHKLRKSVSEVKEERPDILSHCRKLARSYYEKLFEIYCKGDDPYFGPR